MVRYKSYRQTKTTEDNIPYTCYGIEASPGLVPLSRVDDVTCTEGDAERLAGRLNYFGLSILHFRDIIDDFLCF